MQPANLVTGALDSVTCAPTALAGFLCLAMLKFCILMQLDVALSETSCNSARMSVMSPFGPFMQACCHAAVCTGTHPKSGGHSISSELVMLA